MDSSDCVWPVRIYYEDTDAAGIVYHANYLKFMERARTEWLRALGFDVAAMAEQGYVFALRSANLEYLRPARLGDSLEVVTTIKDSSAVRLVMQQNVCLASDHNIVYCTGLITLISVDQNLRPRKWPQELMEKFTHE